MLNALEHLTRSGMKFASPVPRCPGLGSQGKPFDWEQQEGESVGGVPVAGCRCVGRC